jgi:hypothetical protein
MTTLCQQEMDKLKKVCNCCQDIKSYNGFKSAVPLANLLLRVRLPIRFKVWEVLKVGVTAL